MGLSVTRSGSEYQEFVGLYDIGATGAHTLNCGGAGITSVTRTAAGKYTINVSPAVAPLGPLMHVELIHFPIANAGPKNLRPTQTAADTKPAANGTPGAVLYESWSVGTSPAQVELESGCQVFIRLTYLKTK